MFKGKNQLLNPGTTDTLIGEGTIIEGTVMSEASLRIEGQVKGDIVCSGDIVIGEGGAAISDISARNVINAGFIQGNVTTTGTLTITTTGKVQGNIAVQSLIVAEGGTLQGTSRMEPKTPAPDKRETIPIKPKDNKDPGKEIKDKTAV